MFTIEEDYLDFVNPNVDVHVLQNYRYMYWYEIFTTFLESVLGVFVICGIGTSLFSTNTLVNINHNYILDRLSKHILFNATFFAYVS